MQDKSFTIKSLERITFLIAAGLLIGSAALIAAEPAEPVLDASTAKVTDDPPQLKTIGDAQPFDFDRLKSQAKTLAAEAYVPPPAKLPEPIQNLTWDQMQAIRFADAHTLWRELGTKFRVRFFHLGLYNKVPVKMFEVVDGQARQLAYDPELFEYGKSGVDGRKLPKDLGFAGFQTAFHDDWRRDIAAFQGASYFRAVSNLKQYGLSARGLAIDCGLPKPEEFPIFTAYYLERPAKDADQLVVYALLDSPSVTGAYRMAMKPGEPLTMDIDAAVYPRVKTQSEKGQSAKEPSWGFAPLTSMFQCAENDRRMAADFRPEIHDSDGLAIWTGAGEHIWRPLNNPRVLRVNSFMDENPHGFGLMQRDRNFDHYQDDGVFYERRPSVWVEPKQDPPSKLWQRGSVKLVEIPTVDETFDNIVAFWQPADEPQPGDALDFGYRLTWGAQPPHVPKLATVAATRTGIGGVIGKQRTYYSWRFAVDFAGGDLASLGPSAKIEPVITASRGEIEITSARPLDAIHGYRAMFDIKPTDDSLEPIDLRLYLRSGKKALTETWLYQWTPPPLDERKF